jgi:hypothetical protein
VNTSPLYTYQDMQADQRPQETDAAPQESLPQSSPETMSSLLGGGLELAAQARLDREKRKKLPPAPEGLYTAQMMEEDGFKSTSPEPSIAEITTALGTGATRGAAEGATLMAATIAGAKLATPFAPLAGPFAAVVPFVGGGVGFGVGLFASDVVGKLLPGATRKATEPYYEGSRTLFGGLSMAPALMFAKVAQPGANVISKTIGAIGEFARANPGKYLASEAVLNFYAGLAGGSAVAIAPDSPGIKAVAEVTAGIAGSFGPGRLALTLSNTVSDAVNNAITSATSKEFSPRTQNYVQQQILDIINKSGEDPQALLKALDEALDVAKAEGITTTGTVAQMSGSPILTKLQSTIARYNAKFSGDTREMGEQVIKAYDDVAHKLEQFGDPALLTAAAEIRKKALAKQFQDAFNIAQTEALDKASKLGQRGSVNNAQVGAFFRNEVENIVKIGRETESQLWKKAELDMYQQAGGKLKPVKIVPSKFANALYDVRQSSTRGQISSDFANLGEDLVDLGFNAKKLKQIDQIPITEDFLRTRIVADDDIAGLGLEKMSAPAMVKLRGSLLEKARVAGAAGNMDAARRYGILSEALLDDLDALPSGFYNEARSFSREFGDAVKRTFTGKVLKTGKTGEEFFTPEVIIQRAFSSGADTTLMRMTDILDAANFVDPTGVAATSVRSAEQKVLRAVASEALNEDGTVNLTKLDSFRLKNADALKYLGMEDEFRDIASTQRALLDASDPDSLLKAKIADEQAFASLLSVDDPATAVSQALNSTTSPVKNFKSLVETASSPTDPIKKAAARNGLISTLYQHAYQTAIKSGTFKANDFNDVFFKPLSPNTPSLAQMMRSSGLMAPDEIARLKRTTNIMTRVENTLNTQARIVDPKIVFKPQDAIEDLAVSMLGAKFAGAIGPKGAGSLSFAGKTIQTTKNFFNGMPQRQRLLLLEETIKDPALFRQMISRAITEQESSNLTSGILRRLYSPGVYPTALDRYVDTLATEEPPPEQEAPPKSTARQMLYNARPPTPTRGTPGLMNQAPGQPPSAPPPAALGPQGAAPSQSRQMLAALFPEDRMLPGA